MIIRIPEPPDLTSDKHDKIKAIRNAIISFADCKHILWMPVQMIDSLLHEPELGGHEKRALYALRSFSIEAKRLHESFSFYVEIDFSNKSTLDSSSKCCRIGYGHLLDFNIFGEACFLVENSLDERVYRLAGQCHINKLGYEGLFDVTFDPVNGGGSTTFDEYSRLRVSGRFFLCIIDSDMKHPHGPLGDTAQRFEACARGLNDSRWLEVIEVSEIENIIPYNVVASVIEDIKPQKKEEFRNLLDNGFGKYFDYKKGLKKQKATELDEHHGPYWSSHPHYGNVQNDDWICQGLGRKFLDHCLEKMQEKDLGDLVDSIDTSSDCEWERISKIVAAWGVRTTQYVR